MQRGFHQSCTVIQVFTCIKLHMGPSTGPRARAPAPGPSDRQACCGHWCQSVLYLLGGVGRSVWVLVTGFTCAYLARGPLVLRSRVVLVVFVCFLLNEEGQRQRRNKEGLLEELQWSKSSRQTLRPHGKPDFTG